MARPDHARAASGRPGLGPRVGNGSSRRAHPGRTFPSDRRGHLRPASPAGSTPRAERPVCSARYLRGGRCPGELSGRGLSLRHHPSPSSRAPDPHPEGPPLARSRGLVSRYPGGSSVRGTRAPVARFRRADALEPLRCGHVPSLARRRGVPGREGDVRPRGRRRPPALPRAEARPAERSR